MLLDEVDDLFRYWAKFPPAHEAVRLVLIGLGMMKPPEEPASKPRVTDEEVAQVVALRQKWGTA